MFWKNYRMRDYLKERHYTSECLTVDNERLTYICNRLKRKKISFKIKVWSNITVRGEKGNVVKVDSKLNLKKLVEKIPIEYKSEIENGGSIEIVTSDKEWCIYHMELSGQFFCSRILEKLNIKIQEVEDDAKLSDDVPLWIDRFFSELNQEIVSV